MAKKEKIVEENPKRVVEVVYKIFEMTDEGHLRHPVQGSWGTDNYTFHHYSGYHSMEEAAAAIEIHDNTKHNAYGKEYIILPIART